MIQINIIASISILSVFPQQSGAQQPVKHFAASGNLNMGLEGPGKAAVFGNPGFLNYSDGNQTTDFSLTGSSPAIDKGLVLGHRVDFAGVTIPQGSFADIGAFEYLISKGITVLPSRLPTNIEYIPN